MVYGIDDRRRGVLISPSSIEAKHLNKTSSTSLMLHHFSLKAIIIIFTLVFTALLLFLPLLLPPLPPPPSSLLLVPILMLALLLFLALSPSQVPLVPAAGSSSVVWPYVSLYVEISEFKFSTKFCTYIVRTSMYCIHESCLFSVFCVSFSGFQSLFCNIIRQSNRPCCRLLNSDMQGWIVKL